MRRRRRKGPVYRGQTQTEIPKSARRAVVSGIVLFAAALVLGGGYTFYMDRSTMPSSSAIAPTNATSTYQEIKPVKPAANAQEGAAVEASTSLVKIGDPASISVRTNAGSSCKIAVLYDKIASTESGLGPQTADDFGTVTWDWTIGPATPIGMWPVNITCVYHGRTGFVQTNLDVTK